MSRKSEKAPFKKFEGRKPKDKHVRLTRDMLFDKAFLNLNFSSKILYIYMKLWACGNDEVQYSKSLGSNVVAPATYTKAIRELVSAGFIEKVIISTGGGHIPNTYKLSSKWQDK